MNRPLYLKSLSIKNFATFDDSFIEFDPSFNVIAGETGSGKSLILDALSLILGQRADKKLIRKGNDFLIIEAIFYCDDKNISDFFDEMGYPVTDSELIVKRIVYSTGKSKNFINFCQCNLNDLNVFSKRFIDVVGQFENQKLLSEKYQLVLLDKYGKLNSNIENYQSIYSQYKSTCKQIEDLENKQDYVQKELDYTTYLLTELTALDPSVEDEKELISKKSLVVDLEKRQSVVSSLQSLLNDDNGISDQFSVFYKKVISNTELLPNISLDDINILNDKLTDLSSALEMNLTEEIDPEDFDIIMDKLDKYQKLKAKHRTDTQGLVDLSIELNDKKKTLENSETDFANLIKQRSQLFKKASEAATSLHTKRFDIAKKLSSNLTKALQSLNMAGATLKLDLFTTTELTSSGLSGLKILAETNRGEGFFEIKKIASGGELSRILLAFRQVLSSKDTISIFLFDEIDTGIGGETALKIGNSLKEVSNSSQVVAITHLPQIASYSTKVLNVLKQYSSSDNRTFSYVEEVVGLENILSFSKSMSPISQELQ